MFVTCLWSIADVIETINKCDCQLVDKMNWLKDRTLSNLFGCMAVLGMACGGIGIAYVNHINKKLRGQPYYKEAFERLDQNKAAITILGTPIQVNHIRLSDARNQFQPDHVLVHVPIKGRNIKAEFEIEADQVKANESEWIVKQLWLQLDERFDQKRLLVYKAPKSEIELM